MRRRKRQERAEWLGYRVPLSYIEVKDLCGIRENFSRIFVYIKVRDTPLPLVIGVSLRGTEGKAVYLKL